MKKESYPKKININDPLMSLTFVGSGFGESIIINLGGKLLSIVDCCKQVAETDIKYNFSNIFSQSIKISKNPYLGFLLLTHPHFDHFQSLHKLVEEYGNDFVKVCLFNGITEAELAEIYKEQSKKLNHSVSAYNQFKHYSKLLNSLDNNVENSRRRAVAEDSNIFTINVEDKNGKKYDFTIDAIAPSYKNSKKFLSQAKFHNFINLVQNDKKLEQLGNIISVVLLIRFGKTKILLGGDVTSKGWEEILLKKKDDLLDPILVKSSHHGSTEGNPEQLYNEMFSDNHSRKKCKVIIVPFYDKGLPSVKTINMFKKYSLTYELTSSLSQKKDKKISSRLQNVKNIKLVATSQNYYKTFIVDTENEFSNMTPSWALKEHL
ncbi:MAG: hypothetical protein Q8N83_16230 [Ignavibacteria bacterium]|nr:hypothetical protein [Ignavibacteria bacterium]